MTVSEPVRAPGTITLNANGATSDLTTQAGGNGVFSTGATTTLTAGRNLILGTAAGFGDVRGQGVVLNAGGNIVEDNDTFVQADGSAGVQATAGGDVSLLHAIGSGSLLHSNGSGPIAITTGAGHTFTLDSGPGGGIAANGGNITIAADDMVINNGVNANSGIVTLEQAGTTTRAISLGAGATGLGIGNAELGQVTASIVRIGRSDNAGNITVDGAVTSHVGFSTLSLISGGAITDAVAADTITVNNLAVRAAAGISLDTVVPHLGVRNSTSGNVRVANTGATILTAVDTVDGSAGNQQGNFAGGGTTTFSAASPFTFAIDFTSAGTVTATATETNDPGTFADVLTVNAGITVQSTGGNVVLQAGDDVVLGAGAS